MEMEKLSPDPEGNPSSEGTSGTDVKTEGEAIYSKLEGPSEDLYSDPKSHSPKKNLQSKNLWRGVSLCLGAVSLILFFIVLVLVVKLQNGSVCEVTPKNTLQRQPCTAPSCCTSVQPSLCAKGWLQWGSTCFLFGMDRKTWAQSKKFCEDQGGSLAVIPDGTVQKFVSKNGNLQYWIGLKQQNGGWIWVDNRNLVKSFWSASNPGRNDCVKLDSEEPEDKNWNTFDCARHLYYICQKIIQN